MALPLRRALFSGGAPVQPRPHANHQQLLLGLIVGLSFGVALTNLWLGQRDIRLQQEQTFEPPDARIKRGILTLNDGDSDDDDDDNSADTAPVATAATAAYNESGRQPAQNEEFNGDEANAVDTDTLKSAAVDKYNEADMQPVQDGDFITQIMRGKKQFPGGNSLPSRLKYRPGTLQMSSAESLQHCFVNVTHYRAHIPDRKMSLVSLSDHYKLIYRNIPKSSSSTARHCMMDFLEGEDSRLQHDDMEVKVHDKGYSMITFVREPLNRFYSSYDESYFRMGPWMGEGPIVKDKPRVRDWYHNNKWKMDKYPYLFEGLTTIADFRKLYCPKEVLAMGNFLECNGYQSIDDGVLSHRFEQFVRDYSGLDPFDIHLNLQIGNLVFPTGEPFPMTTIFNASEAEAGWQEIAREKRVEIPNGEMIHGRKITRRFNVSMVSDEAKRKVCRLLALDYCCFNIELPKVCTEAGEDETVYCAMEKRDEDLMKYALEPFVIHPWRDP